MMAELTKIANAFKGEKSASKNWDYNQCSKYKFLHEFDILVHKSIKIAFKRNNEIGEEGWFTILEFLSSYLLTLNDKLDKL